MSIDGTEGQTTGTTTEGSVPTDRAALTESERATALTTGKVPIDRAAALRAGSVPVPRKFVRLIIIAFAVLGLGGIVAEKLIGNAGVGALVSTPVTTLAGTGGSDADTNSTPGAVGSGPSTSPTPPNTPAIGASPSGDRPGPSCRKAGSGNFAPEPERTDLDLVPSHGKSGRSHFLQRRVR